MAMRTYTIGYPFGGSGVGASGSDAVLSRAAVLGAEALLSWGRS